MLGAGCLDDSWFSFRNLIEVCGGRGTGEEEPEEECVKCHSLVAKEGSYDSLKGGVTTRQRARAQTLALAMPGLYALPRGQSSDAVPSKSLPCSLCVPTMGQWDTGLSCSWAWGRAAPGHLCHQGGCWGHREPGAGQIRLHPFFSEQ